MASDDDLSLPPNLRSFKASEPINKPMMPLLIIKEEREDKEDIIIVDKGIKKRSVPLGVMSEKHKRLKSLTLIDRLPN